MTDFQPSGGQPTQIGRLQLLSFANDAAPLLEQLAVLRRPRTASDVVPSHVERAIRSHDQLLRPLGSDVGAPQFADGRRILLSIQREPQELFIVPTTRNAAYLWLPQSAPLIVQSVSADVSFAIDYVGVNDDRRASVIAGIASDRVTEITVDDGKNLISIPLQDNVFFHEFEARSPLPSLTGLVVKFSDGSNREISLSGSSVTN